MLHPAFHTEGMAFGVPIYFATGSRWKAIIWSLIDGMTEVLGAVIGLAVELTDSRSPLAMGITMGLVRRARAQDLGFTRSSAWSRPSGLVSQALQLASGLGHVQPNIDDDR